MKVVVLDASNKPKCISEADWIKEGDLYTLGNVRVCKTNEIVFELVGYDIEELSGGLLDSIRSSRFGIVVQENESVADVMNEFDNIIQAQREIESMDLDLEIGNIKNIINGKK